MPAKDSQLVAARRARLREWIAEKFGGSQATFVAHTKLNQGMLSGLLKPDGKSFGEKVAANLEVVAKMPPGHLVKALDPSQEESQPAGLDLETLQIALVAVKKAIRAADVEIDLYSTAPLIALAYRERSGLPAKPTQAQLKQFDKHISERLLEGVGNGEWKDGRAAGDGAEGAQGSKAKKAANRGR